MALAFAPGDLLPNAAARTIHPAQGVQKENRQPPQGDKFEPSLWLDIIARPWLTAMGTSGFAAPPSPDLDFKERAVLLFAPPDRPIDKTRMPLNSIQE